MDLTVQAMSGIMSVTGFPDRPPVKAGPAVCDFFGGIHLYGAIATALFDRERTGEGRVVEASMYESVYAVADVEPRAASSAPARRRPLRTGNRHSASPRRRTTSIRRRDGYLAIICVTDAHWRILATAMGREDLAEHPDFADTRGALDADRRDRRARVGAWTADFEHGRAVRAAARRAGVPCAPVRDLAEVVDDEHLHERGMLREIDHPELGP